MLSYPALIRELFAIGGILFAYLGTSQILLIEMRLAFIGSEMGT